jgi:hypothetical protein
MARVRTRRPQSCCSPASTASPSASTT